MMKTVIRERNSNWLLPAVIVLIFIALLVLLTCRSQRNTATIANTEAINRLPIPKINANDEIVQHTAYTLSYNKQNRQANWVAYLLTAGEVNGAHVVRTNRFMPDPAVKTGSATDADYEGSGYDRGHLANAEDMSYSTTTMTESFYYSNMSPQVPAFNRGVWKRLEALVRFWATQYDSIYIVTGPVLTNGLPTIGPDPVSVPQYFYKVILEYNSKRIKGIGFVLKNETSSATLKSFAVPIDSVEHLTGIDFFPKLPDDVENKVEADPTIDQWKWTRKE